MVHLPGDGVAADHGGRAVATLGSGAQRGTAAGGLEGDGAALGVRGTLGGDGHAYAFWFWVRVVSSATLSANAVVNVLSAGIPPVRMSATVRLRAVSSSARP